MRVPRSCHAWGVHIMLPGARGFCCKPGIRVVGSMVEAGPDMKCQDIPSVFLLLWQLKDPTKKSSYIWCFLAYFFPGISWNSWTWLRKGLSFRIQQAGFSARNLNWRFPVPSKNALVVAEVEKPCVRLWPGNVGLGAKSWGKRSGMSRWWVVFFFFSLHFLNPYLPPITSQIWGWRNNMKSKNLAFHGPFCRSCNVLNCELGFLLLGFRFEMEGGNHIGRYNLQEFCQLHGHRKNPSEATSIPQNGGLKHFFFTPVKSVLFFSKNYIVPPIHQQRNDMHRIFVSKNWIECPGGQSSSCQGESLCFIVS